MKRYIFGLSWEFIKGAATVIALAFILRYFVFQPFLVSGASMEPNFYDKEYLLVDKLSYRFRMPQRGETVIFHPPNAPADSYIKRVVGLPGETVEVKDGKVFINNYPLAESYLGQVNSTYLSSNQKDKILKITLSQNQFFVMGDNREHSTDSREIGPIPKSNLEGRAALRVLPTAHAGFVKAPGY